MYTAIINLCLFCLVPSIGNIMDEDLLLNGDGPATKTETTTTTTTTAIPSPISDVLGSDHTSLGQTLNTLNTAKRATADSLLGSTALLLPPGENDVDLERIGLANDDLSHSDCLQDFNELLINKAAELEADLAAAEAEEVASINSYLSYGNFSPRTDFSTSSNCSSTFTTQLFVGEQLNGKSKTAHSDLVGDKTGQQYQSRFLSKKRNSKKLESLLSTTGKDEPSQLICPEPVVNGGELSLEIFSTGNPVNTNTMTELFEHSDGRISVKTLKLSPASSEDSLATICAKRLKSVWNGKQTGAQSYSSSSTSSNSSSPASSVNPIETKLANTTDDDKSCTDSVVDKHKANCSAKSRSTLIRTSRNFDLEISSEERGLLIKEGMLLLGLEVGSKD